MPRLLSRRARIDGFSGDVAPEAHSDIVAVLDTVAAVLDSGVVLLDGYDVILANDAALALRVVRRTSLTSPLLSRLVREARREGNRIEEEVELPWGAGWRSVAVTVAPVVGTQRVVVLLRDLTEARRVEAVRRDFVASVSHELKTPVGGLLLLAEAVREAVDDPEATLRFANRMVHEADRLSRLVHDLIDLSRIQGGDPLPAPGLVGVQELLGDAVDRVRVSADAAGIEIAVADCADLQLWGDERSLCTALSNLLDNALNYSTRGSRVAIGARLASHDGGEEVELFVADQGIGIAQPDLERVFERFYRTDPARSRRTGGNGLGLSIVKHIIENSGGRISVWSQVGVGSTFTLHLPTPSESAGGLQEPVALPEPVAPRQLEASETA